MGRFYLSLILFLIASPSYAAPYSSPDATKYLSLNAPAQQSECEIRSNKIKAAHPHLEMFQLMNRYHIFMFGPAVPPSPPSTYRESESGITFYVESDGRHVAAIDSQGKLLWVRNPYVDANLCPYRSAHPFIRSIGSAQTESHNPDFNAAFRDELLKEIKRGMKVLPPQSDDRFISLTFNSSNYGYLNIRDGEYYDMGQN